MDLIENFTAVFEKDADGFIAYIEEMPGVNTQGDTLDETRANLIEALDLVISVYREMAEDELIGKTVIREPADIIIP